MARQDRVTDLNIVMLSRYDRTGASSRLRMFQYAPYLEDHGCSVVKAPFFDSAYLTHLYSGRHDATAAARSYLGRLRQLLQTRKADLLWIEKELLPWIPWIIERTLIPRGTPVVTDYDDAIFHRYDLHGSGVVRRLLGTKIDNLMKHSRLVLAGNTYLKNRAHAAGARRIEIVPTVVDIESYAAKTFLAGSRTPYIGWIGTPSTWKQYVTPMMPLLGGIIETHSARMMAVGAGQAADLHPLLDILPWSEESEVAMIQKMDIGIMPLTDTPWARGKCGYKLIQYLACGLPVVASPVGVNADLIEHGVNGFLASTHAEWRSALGKLLSDADLRLRMGAAGRRKIELDYSLQIWGPRVACMLRDATVPGGVV
jgi:hypothetical protein